MSDPLKSAKLRCDWGKNHAADLKQRILSFIREYPPTRFIEGHPDGIYEIHKVELAPLPDEFALVTGDAVYSFRAALDHAVYAVLGATDKVKPRRGAKFPFGDTAADFKKKGGVFEHFPDEIKPFFMSFKPYQRGNYLLWALNKICNTDKHRGVVLVATGCTNIRCVPDKAFRATSIHIGRVRKNEIITAIIGPDQEFHYDGDIRLAVTFGEIIRGVPVVAFLDQLATIVDGILLGLEAEARKLGYI